MSLSPTLWESWPTKLPITPPPNPDLKGAPLSAEPDSEAAIAVVSYGDSDDEGYPAFARPKWWAPAAPITSLLQEFGGAAEPDPK
eukprot:gene11842-13982_t